MSRPTVLWILPLAAVVALHLVERHDRTAELTALRSELAPPTKASPRAAEPSRAPPAWPSVPWRRIEPVTPAAPTPAEPPPSLAELRGQLERAFSQQVADAGSEDARRTIEGRLAGVLPETSRLQALECRGSMCRIETAHQVERYPEFVQAAFLTPETRLGDGPQFSTVLGDPVDGRIVTVSYLARDGQQLPRLGAL